MTYRKQSTQQEGTGAMKPDGRDNLTPEEATRLLLDEAWNDLTDREARERARKINDLCDLALEVEGGHRV